MRRRQTKNFVGAVAICALLAPLAANAAPLTLGDPISIEFTGHISSLDSIVSQTASELEAQYFVGEGVSGHFQYDADVPQSTHVGGRTIYDEAATSFVIQVGKVGKTGSSAFSASTADVGIFDDYMHGSAAPLVDEFVVDTSILGVNKPVAGADSAGTLATRMSFHLSTTATDTLSGLDPLTEHLLASLFQATDSRGGFVSFLNNEVLRYEIDSLTINGRLVTLDTDTPPAPVPLPSAMLLFGGALGLGRGAGLLGSKRRPLS